MSAKRLLETSRPACGSAFSFSSLMILATASVGVGCLRASDGSRLSIGFGSKPASVLSTLAMSASGFPAGWAEAAGSAGAAGAGACAWADVNAADAMATVANSLGSVEDEGIVFSG